MEDNQIISEEFSFAREKEIAKSFSKRFQWEMIAIGLGQVAVWLTLWPMVIYSIIPLWAGFLIATICACFAYLPSHEAQHGNYSRGNPKMKWLDGFVGHLTLITLAIPYHLLRVTHMKHHAYTNNSIKDPDYDNAHGPLFSVIKNARELVSKLNKLTDKVDSNGFRFKLIKLWPLTFDIRIKNND